MSLYAISSELELILDAILEGGADSPEGQQALEAHLAGLDAALDDKADDYAGLIRSLELRSAARKAEADRMRAGNGGKQPLSVTCDATTLPKELTTVTVAANKEAIRQALEAGATIAGCELLPRGTSLRIR